MAHTGAMIALFPDKAYLGRMARAAQCMPHAQPIDDLHVTVCYLGTDADLDKAAVIAALQQFRSPVPMPLLLRIRGLDRFPTREDDGTNALYARVICPELHTLRDSLIAALDTVGVKVRNDFGSYTPHMTLGYAPEYLPTPNVRIPLITIPVGAIQLNWADDEPMVFPMTNQAQTKEVSGPMATPAHGPGGLFSNPALSGAPRRRSKSAQRRLGLSTKPFASTAQQRFAFSTGQPWAKRWADETDFSKLPAKVKASAEDTGSGSASGGGKGYGARAGEVIRGNLTRGGNGQFASAGSGSSSGYMPKPPKAPKKPKGGGKGAGAKPKKPKDPKAPKLTPEERRAQREAERAAEQAENRAKVIGDLGLLEDAAGALEDLRSNGLTADDGGLEKLGLAEQTKDGQYRLTAAGKAVLSAANRGDSAEAKAALSKGSDRAAEQRAAAEEAAAAEAESSAEGEKKPKGGGGGGGAKEDPADPKDLARIARAGAGGAAPTGVASGGTGANAPAVKPLRAGPNREAAIGAFAERVGIGREGLQALRGAAEGARIDPAAGASLVRAGLAEQRGDGYEATDQGRQALSAVERGNLRNWQSAVQNAQNRLQREAAAREREETRKKVVRLLALELELLRLKHGKHNQASHGKKGRAGRAGAAAYQAARAGGAGHSEALQAGRAATATERQSERIERQQRRTDRLNTQAQRARAAANGGQVTQAQRAALLQKADRLEARARGEKVGPKVKPAPTPEPAPVKPKRAPRVRKPKSEVVDPNTPDTKAYAAVKAREQQIRKQPFESAFVVDGKGNKIIDKDGGQYEVEFNRSEIYKIRKAENAVFTHNHPRGLAYPTSSPMHHGGSFSPEDIQMAAGTGVYEMRAVTPTRTFYVRRPKDGWDQNYHDTKVDPVYRRYERETKDVFGAAIREGRMSIDQANADHYHTIWSKVFGELGVEYGYTND